MKKLVFLLTFLFASGCTTITKQQEPNGQFAQVTFYRTNQLQGSVSDTYIGWNGKYYYTLSTGDQVTTKVPVGFIDLNVKSKVDVANELPLEIKPNQRYCVSVEVNPENIILINWLVPGYQLTSIPCPNENMS
ncbi:hypothetical protein Q4493_14750 [Colwellia sp. 1_MG-2023]|uniref:hypothetical protein n=1 Tax=Colwellia sp. 1_MG-2023 TaxID=3062649 RepID=UPI0026E42447|nr:hypothetical protein [Colwellia sp. 1_MG-2023]MDO6447027.1 hypothetical protein [Colwellia sp. 1_MG-2023]